MVLFETHATSNGDKNGCEDMAMSPESPNNGETSTYDFHTPINNNEYEMMKLGGDLERQTSRISNHERAARTGLLKLVMISADSSLHFVSFHRKLGSSLYEKYCGGYQLNANICLFIHVLYGMAQCIFGVFALVNEPPIIDIGVYMVVGGVLNSLVFPILIMEWSNRIGGCIEEGQKSESSPWWPVILVFRLFYNIAGTAILLWYYPSFMDDLRNPNFTEQNIFLVTFLVYICCDWALLILVILCPLWCLCLVFLLAKYITGPCCTMSSNKPEAVERFVHAPAEHTLSAEDRCIELVATKLVVNRQMDLVNDDR